MKFSGTNYDLKFEVKFGVECCLTTLVLSEDMQCHDRYLSLLTNYIELKQPQGPRLVIADGHFGLLTRSELIFVADMKTYHS